jgi:ubiquinone/menaquinone biosynthesis C-methylase UbiE
MSENSDSGERFAVSGIEVDEPVLGREAVERFYQDPRVAKDYEAHRFAAGWKHPEEIDALRRFVRRARPTRLLDLATGSGRAVRGVAADVTGLAAAVDLSRPMLDANRASESTARVCYTRASAFALPFATGSLDFLVCLRCIRHFDGSDRKSIYAEIRRVLRPGGHFVLDAANHALHADQLADRHIFDETYTRGELRRELEQNGFRIGQWWGTVTGWEWIVDAAIRRGVPERFASAWFHRLHRWIRARPAVVDGSYLWILRCERP